MSEQPEPQTELDVHLLRGEQEEPKITITLVHDVSQAVDSLSRAQAEIKKLPAA